MKKVLLLTAIALIAAACSNPAEVKNTANSSAVNSPVNTETVRNAETAESEKAKNEILNSTKKIRDLKFWSAKIVSETPELNGEMEYLAPDRFRLKTSEGEAIIIGKNSYVNETGKWEISKEDLSGLINAKKNSMTEEVIKNVKNVQILGKEPIDGKPATIYFHKNSEENVGEVTTKTWITDDSGLVIKSEVETKIGKETQKLVTLYDYDKKVSIEAPKID